MLLVTKKQKIVQHCQNSGKSKPNYFWWQNIQQIFQLLFLSICPKSWLIWSGSLTFILCIVLCSTVRPVFLRGRILCVKAWPLATGQTPVEQWLAGREEDSAGVQYCNCYDKLVWERQVCHTHCVGLSKDWKNPIKPGLVWLERRVLQVICGHNNAPSTLERKEERKLVITMASYALQRHLGWPRKAAWANFSQLTNDNY